MYTLTAADKQLYDDGKLSIKGLVEAYKEKDPRLCEYACKLVTLDPYPTSQIDYSSLTAAIVGHSHHGMSTVFAALKAVLKKRGGHIKEDHSEFTFTDAQNQQFVGLDAMTNQNSQAAIQRAQILCLVVSAEDGVMPQTRSLVSLAIQSKVNNIVVFISKVDALDESERDAQILNVQADIQALLVEHALSFDAHLCISGSAFLALKGDMSPIGTPAIERLAAALEGGAPPNKRSQMITLKRYADFRKNYHADAIKTDILRQIQPSYSGFGKGTSGHQKVRRQKAELFSQRFTQFQQQYPEHIPDRFKVGEFMLMLYEDNSDYASDQLLDIIQKTPLKWGPWQAFKFILKRGILDQRWLLFATAYNRWLNINETIVTGRHHRRPFPETYLPNDVSTLDWNSLYSASYRSNYRALNTVKERAAEITTESRLFLNKFFRRIYTEQYNALSPEIQESVTTEILMIAPSFSDSYYSRDIWVTWARALTWTSPDSANRLMRLWQHAQNERVQSWAFYLLQQKHESVLVNLPMDWLLANGTNPRVSSVVRTFIINWICKPITQIPKADFIKVGLHKIVLTFLDPGYGTLQNLAVQYACNFIRQFMDELAPQIPLDKVLWFLRHTHQSVHELGVFLLFPDGEKQSPFQDQLTLDFWTDLISNNRMHTYAVKAIKDRYQHQISFEWLKNRLYSSNHREISLAKDFIRDGFHVRDLDFYPLYYANTFSQPGQTSLYDWSWNALNKEDTSGFSLLKDRFTVSDYRKLLLSKYPKNALAAIDAYKNERISQNDFSIEFLKHLISNQEWSTRGVQSTLRGLLAENLDEKTQWKNNIPIDFPSSLKANVMQFARTTLFSRTDCTLQNLGYKWVFDRRNQPNSEYRQIREMFDRQFPNYALQVMAGTAEAELQNTAEGNQKGINLILKEIDSDLYSNGPKAQFWKSFIENRLERVATLNRKPFEYSAECTVSQTHFSFEWFDQQLSSEKSQYHHQFALEMAGRFLTDWIASSAEPVGFKFLKSYLFSNISSVSDFFFSAISNPQTHYARIDLNSDAFLPEELFEYCYSSDPKVRSTGLRFIQQYPEKFAQPDKLVELTTSPDENVRALVIEILYKIAHIPLVTPNWRPYEDSVIPGNMNRSSRDSRKQQTSYSNPPQNPISMVKYLGKGTGTNLQPNLTNHARLVIFAVQQLFQLPANPRKKSASNIKKVPMWKMKRVLIESFRDLALQDRDFAELIVPVFEELTQYKGKMVRESVWTALSYIEAKYDGSPIQSLNVFNP